MTSADLFKWTKGRNKHPCTECSVISVFVVILFRKTYTYAVIA